MQILYSQMKTFIPCNLIKKGVTWYKRPNPAECQHACQIILFFRQDFRGILAKYYEIPKGLHFP